MIHDKKASLLVFLESNYKLNMFVHGPRADVQDSEEPESDDSEDDPKVLLMVN